MTQVRWLATALAAVIVSLAFPADTSAQCLTCRPCYFGPGIMCVGVQQGTPGAQENCGQDMFGGHCGCKAYGGSDCDWPFANASEAAESEHAAVLAVKSGEMLTSDGPYYFVVSENTAALRRRCDHSLVARVALTTQNAQRTRNGNVVGG